MLSRFAARVGERNAHVQVRGGGFGVRGRRGLAVEESSDPAGGVGFACFDLGAGLCSAGGGLDSHDAGIGAGLCQYHVSDFKGEGAELGEWRL